MGEPPPVLAEVVRSGFVEGHHRGHVVVLRSDGSALLQLGDVTSPMFPRSCNKPMQAVGMLTAGLDLPDDLLALAAASHSGEQSHLSGVRRVLEGAGLSESDLGTPPMLPLGDGARTAWIASGAAPAPIASDCSGKHAAMLATCVANGWATTGYLAPTHPLQQHLAAEVGRVVGEPAAHVGVDGCGAPVFSMSLTALAGAYRALVLAARGTPERRVADAMRAHPDLVGGTGRDVTDLMQGVPGLLAKDGAEAVFAAALPDGSALAVKIDDGGIRARPVVVAAALRSLGVDAPVIDDLAELPLLGGGVPVGTVRPVPFRNDAPSMP